uniref:Uncharacterized protein n=1 Tax=Rhizophora mucronata TaxID=61149 RepID=A0A2P2PTH8_RHIMU
MKTNYGNSTKLLREVSIGITTKPLIINTN